MVLNFFETLLWPIITLIGWGFEGLFGLTGSAGLSIILLSVLVGLLSYPLGVWAHKVELRHRLRKQKVDTEVAKAVQGLKGEERFRATERVYKSHDYHPISTIASGLPFFVMLPFLLSALFLFSDHPALVGQPFLFVSDLSQPDGVLGGLNLLPFIMTGITVLDARARFSGDRSAMVRFLIIAAVLFALVYNFAAGIVLYWITSNLMSFASFIWRRARKPV